MIGQISARCRSATSLEPVYDRLRTCLRPDSVMEFGFYCDLFCDWLQLCNKSTTNPNPNYIVLVCCGFVVQRMHDKSTIGCITNRSNEVWVSISCGLVEALQPNVVKFFCRQGEIHRTSRLLDFCQPVSDVASRHHLRSSG